MAELTPQQIARIEYLVHDEWVLDSDSPEDELNSKANFRAALAKMSSIELHHFAQHFNWDGGTEELECVIDHPKCDAGTALLIFWLAGPVDCFRRAAKGKLQDSEVETYEWLKRIESRFVSNEFAQSEIAVNPREERLTMGTDLHREYINERMFVPTPGTELERLSF